MAEKMIIKVSIPKGVYTDDETRKIYDLIKTQAGEEYVVIMAPEDVKLEIIE